jgi:hypothetical protein
VSPVEKVECTGIEYEKWWTREICYLDSKKDNQLVTSPIWWLERVFDTTALVSASVSWLLLFDRAYRQKLHPPTMLVVFLSLPYVFATSLLSGVLWFHWFSTGTLVAD